MAGLSDDKDRAVKFGSLIQVGWLLETENNIYIGLGLSVKDHFEEVTSE